MAHQVGETEPRPTRSRGGDSAVTVSGGQVNNWEWNPRLKSPKVIRGDSSRIGKFQQDIEENVYGRSAWLDTTLPIIGARPTFTPAKTEKKSEAALAQEIADFLTWHIVHRTSGTWREHMQEAVTYLFGWVGFYPVYQADKWRGRDMWVMDSVQIRHPRSHDSWTWDDDGKFSGWNQWVQTPGPDQFKLIHLPAEELLMIWNEKIGSNFEGRPFNRSTHLDSDLLEKALINLAIATQRVALPIPQITLPPGASEDDIAKAENIAARLQWGENAYVVWRNIQIEDAQVGEWQLTWIQAPIEGLKWMVEVAKFHGENVHRGWLSHHLNAGDDGGGSLALNQTHVDTKTRMMESIKKTITEAWTLREHAPLAKLVLWNFGERGLELMPNFVLVDTETHVKIDPGAAQVVMEIKATIKSQEDLDAALPLIAATMGTSVDVAETMVPPIVEEEEEAPAAGVGTGGEEKVADTALNGAQVQAAQSIVSNVAAGLIPRDAGLGMLQHFFKLPLNVAEDVMGSVGKGFEPIVPDQIDDPDKKKALSLASLEEPEVRLARNGRPLRDSELLAVDLDSLEKARDIAERRVEQALEDSLEKVVGKFATKIEENLDDPDAIEAMRPAIEKELGKVAATALKKALEEAAKAGVDEFKKETARQLSAFSMGQTALYFATQAEINDQRVNLDVVRRRDRHVERLIAAAVVAVMGRLATLADGIEDDAVPPVKSALVAGLIAGVVADMRAEGKSATRDTIQQGRKTEEERSGIQVFEFSNSLNSGRCKTCIAVDGRLFVQGTPEFDEHHPPFSKCESTKGKENRCNCFYFGRPDLDPDEI